MALAAPTHAFAYVNEWTAVGQPPVVGGMLAISPHFASDTTIFVGSEGESSVSNQPINGGIARSTNGGKTWTKVGYAAGARLISALALAPDFTLATGVALAGTSDEPGRLYRSADGGTTWTRVGASLPNVGTIADICFSPSFATDRTVFVSYALGDQVAFSTDGGATWQVPNRRLDGATVGSIAMSGRAAIVAGEGLDQGAYQGKKRVVLRTSDGARWNVTAVDAEQFERVDMTGLFTALAITRSGATFGSADGGATWQPKGAPPRRDAGEYDSALRGLDMVDANVGYACGSSLSVFRTTDGGLTWNDVSPPEETDEEGNPVSADASTQFADIKALSASEAWAAVAADNRGPDAATVYRTTDAGRTWSKQTLPTGGLTQIELRAIDFGDASHGCAVGTAFDADASQLMAVAYNTSNGGATWTRTFAKQGPWLQDVCLTGSSACVAVGTLSGATDGRHVVLRSSDGGVTWGETASPYDYPTSLAFGEGSRGLLGASGRLFATTDGGATWHETNVGAPKGDLSASPGFASDRTILLAAAVPDSSSEEDVAALYRSTDGGYNFSPLSAKGISGRIVSVEYSPTFATDRIMIALNAASTYFRTTDGGANWKKVLGPIYDGGRSERGAVFSPNWASDHTVFVLTQGLMFKSVNSGASFYPLGSHAPELTNGISLRPDFARNPVAYGVAWKHVLAYRFGARGKARFTKPEVSTGATSRAKLFIVRGKLAPMHPHVDTNGNMWWGGPSVRFYLEKLSGSTYRPYKTYTKPDFWNYGGTVYDVQILWSPLPVGKYRVRAYHTCSGEGGHVPSYSSWTTFTRTSGFSYRTWK